MNEMLQKYALIAEIISALSIVFSLIYVGIQIRQNTSATNGSTIQEISNQSLNLAMMGVENRDLRLAWERSTRGVEYMTTEDISILTWMYLAVIRIAENRFRQMQLGTIKTSAAKHVGGGSSVYKNPYFKIWWEAAKVDYPDDFNNYVEKYLLPDEKSASPVKFPLHVLLPEARDALPNGPLKF